MKYSIQVIDNKVVVKSRGVKIPIGNYEISSTQYNQRIDGATVNALPSHDEQGNIIDADLTLEV